jgi:hypothetical protein
LWFEKIACIISVDLNPIRYVLWIRMQSILVVNIPCELGRNMYSSVGGWGILNLSIICIWSLVLFSSTMSLVIFCLLDLPSSDNGVFECSVIVVGSSISLSRSTSFCLIIWVLCCYVHSNGLGFRKISFLSLCYAHSYHSNFFVLWSSLCLNWIEFLQLSFD